MKILVLSDSHSALSFMRLCIERVQPDAVIHLGDHYDDGETIREEYPGLRVFHVPGNCDRYRCPPNVSEILVDNVLGVELYMTHGHKHNVKFDTGRLLAAARACRVQAVLYGHTHVPNCYREPDGLWVLNPGSCGYYGGTAGLILVENRQIVSCNVIKQEDLEEFA